MSAASIAPVAGTYSHPDFGEVVVHTRANSRTLRAFWRDSSLVVSIPSRCSTPDLTHFLESARDRLLQARVTRFSMNQIIDAGECDISIVPGAPSQSEPLRISLNRRNPRRTKRLNFSVSLKPDMAARIADTAVQKALNRAVKSCAVAAAREFIIPLAAKCAAEVGRYPGMWTVKDSVRALGRCNTQGVIQLSPRLVFLPAELRRFVIFHELAHLSEMNHSDAFHELCDRYVGGRERELDRRLKAFRFPID